MDEVPVHNLDGRFIVRFRGLKSYVCPPQEMLDALVDVEPVGLDETSEMIDSSDDKCVFEGNLEEANRFKCLLESKIVDRQGLVRRVVAKEMGPMLHQLDEMQKKLEGYIAVAKKVKEERKAEFDRLLAEPIKNTKKTYPKGIKIVKTNYPDTTLDVQLIQIDSRYRGHRLDLAVNLAFIRCEVSMALWQILFVLSKNSSGLFSSKLYEPFDPDSHYTVHLVPKNLKVEYLYTDEEVTSNMCRLWKIFDAKGRQCKALEDKIDEVYPDNVTFRLTLHDLAS